MDIFTIRQQLRTTRLSDIPLRVTFYARVSTDSDEQLNSLDNQIGYYRDYITRNPAWTFIDGYIDEGLSGMTTRKRDNFQRMVQDAKDDKFDLILTKEITRFARNTLDSIRYTRELLSAGVGVFFQNDNINTFDEDSELRLSYCARAVSRSTGSWALGWVCRGFWTWTREGYSFPLIFIGRM